MNPAPPPASAAPKVGEVIRLNYLCSHEQAEGKTVSDKNRPCAIVIATELNKDTGTYRVIVAPITHTPPVDADAAVTLAPATQKRLGLDTEQSYIIASELNQIDWPAALSIAGADEEGRSYGLLPAETYKELNRKIQACHQAKREALRAQVSGKAPPHPGTS